jgi:hypothetical protein
MISFCLILPKFLTDQTEPLARDELAEEYSQAGWEPMKIRSSKAEIRKGPPARQAASD